MINKQTTMITYTLPLQKTSYPISYEMLRTILDTDMVTYNTSQSQLLKRMDFELFDAIKYDIEGGFEVTIES